MVGPERGGNGRSGLLAWFGCGVKVSLVAKTLTCKITCLCFFVYADYIEKNIFVKYSFSLFVLFFYI